MTSKIDPKADRERRQAEALKANLRRRKAQSRAQAAGDPDARAAGEQSLGSDNNADPI
jgi:hypothetical protein